MAGFDDSNDIKINVTLDTEAAVKAAQDLKIAIEGSLKATETQFQKLQQLSKGLSSALVEQSKAAGQVQVANTKQVLDQTVAANAAAADKTVKISEEAAAKKVRAEQKAQAQILEAQKVAARQAETAAREAAEKEKTRRTELLKEIAQLNKDRALIKRAPKGELPEGLGGIVSSGKGLKGLGDVALSLGNRFGFVTANVKTLTTALGALGPIGAVLGTLAVGAGLFAAAVNKLNEPVDKLARQAGNLEGLKVAFETLQRSVGQDPAASINALREATQGLISDTELYQRANQAVLLGVPTKTFNEAAAAAVKLGRAMGIDAAFGLESLSLGLGRQSRLYLDNLGIIVSAEEAYLRFAQANNIVGRTLTDSEKKAAFFEEALRKIKERADELPDILDSVGIALKKVEVAQSNVSAKFLEGFNRTSELAKAYGDQAKLVQGSADTFERLGAIAGAIGAKLKALQNVLVELGLVALTDVALGVDGAFGISKQQQLEDAALKVALIEQAIKETTEAINDPSLDKAFLPGLKRSLFESQAELAIAKKAVEDLGVELGIVQVQGANGIKIKVDLTDLNAAKLRLAGFIDELQADVLAAGGEFEIPGLSKETLSAALKGYEELIKQRQLGAIDAEAAKAKLSQIIDPVALELQQSQIKAINSQIALLTAEQIRLAGATGKGSDEISNQIKVLEAQRKTVQKGAGITEQALEKLQKATKAAGAEGVKGANKVTQSLKDQGKEVKKVQKEFESFVKSLRRSLDTAIPDSFQRELVNIFNSGVTSGEEFEKALIDLGRRAQEAGVDLEALKKEIAELQKLAEQGIEIKISSDATKAAEEYNQELARIQQQAGNINIRDILFGEEKDATGKKAGGGFFGFDISGVEIEGEGQLAQTLQDTLSSALRMAAEGVGREDAPEIGRVIGTAVGAAIGAYFGDPQTGAMIGGLVGEIGGTLAQGLGKDKPGTRERKAIDEYFAELFDGERLAIVLTGQLTGAIDEATGQAVRNLQPQVARISDLTFEGMTAMAGNVDFGGEGFTNYFNTLSTDVQAAFNGIGLAFGTLNGVATEQARLIGIALANNVGGSLQNLQVLIQATGESFEDLANAVLNSFLDAQLTIEEAYNALVQLQNLYQVGLPNALGAYEEAARNLFNILEDDRPGRYAVDSLRDIGAEGIEAKKTFDAVISSLGQTFTFTAEQQTRLFEALRINGITSLQQLQNASNEQLLAILENIRRIRENATAPLVTTPQISSTTTSAPRASGPRRKSPEEEAREKLREETKKLLRDSIEYQKILEKITSGELARAAAGLQIVKLQKEIEDLLRRRNDLEKKLNAELDKGSKANKKRLADLAAQLDAVNENIENFTKKAETTTRVFKELNLKGVIPFIRDANNLGVIMKQVGIQFDKASDILVKGFLQGRLSLAELRAELDKTKETLGPGIPNAVGAVTDAFQNLIDAGTQGGQFSVDAFTDIFAEFREKFQKEGSALRKATQKQLNDNLRTAQEAFAKAVGPEATAAAKKTLDEARKALDDFNAGVSAPDLSDLRAQLEGAFGRQQVDKFFQALDESGLKTFEDFERAGSSSVVGILTKLQELGFNFNQTSQDIIDAQNQLVAAEKEANAGLDPMQEAINLIKGLNEGAAQLPPVFKDTTDAVNGLNIPLTALADGFDDILEKVSKLSTQSFSTDVVFNVSTVGDAGSKALVDILFGDGEGTTQDVKTTTSGSSESNAAKIAKYKQEIADLKRKGLNDRRRKRIDTLRRRIAELGG